MKLTYIKKAWNFLIDGDYKQAEKFLELGLENTLEDSVQSLETEQHYYICIVMLKLYPELVLAKEGVKRSVFWSSYSKLNKQVENDSDSFFHLAAIIEAEISRIKELDYLFLIKAYDTAIEGAKSKGFTQHAAFCCELAGDFFHEKKISRLAKSYYNEAIKLYTKWGALSKVKELSSRLQPIYNNIKIVGKEENARVASNSSLDLSTIINATITLSKEVELKNVLKRMLDIVVKTAGADKVLYLVNENFNSEGTEEKWVIQACVDTKDNKIEVLQNQLFTNKEEETNDKIIRYVINTKIFLMIDDLSTDERFNSGLGGFFGKNISVLCAPIEHQNKFHSLFYLENNYISGAFTIQKSQIITALSRQLAISYENARLFSKLSSSLTQLQDADNVLRNKTEELESVYDGILDGLMITDAKDFSIIKVNMVLVSLLGFSMEDLNKLGREGMYPQEDLPWINKQISRLMNGEISVAQDIPFKTKSGSKIWLDIKLNTIQYHNKPAFIGFFRDVTDRYQQNLLLKEKSYELNKAQEIGNMGSWVWNIESGDLKWSDQIYRIFGLEPQEFGATYDAFLEYVHPEDIEKVNNGVDKAIKKEEDYYVEHRIVQESGSIRKVVEKGEVFFDEQGNPTKMIGTVKDVTEQSIIIDLLERWKNVFEHAQWGIAVGYLESETLNLVNPAYAKMHGYELDELINFPIKNLYKPESHKKIPEWVTLSEQQGHATFEVNRLHKNGTEFPVQIELTTVKDDRGKILYRITHVQDISERKKAEEALIESEKKYKQLFEIAQEGIWVLDKDSNTSFVNPSMARMLGYSMEEMLDKHFFEFMDEKGVQVAKYNLERREAGVVEQHDFEFLKKSGQKLIAAIETAPIFDETGTYQGAIAGVMDVTSRKVMEQQLRENEATLEQKVFERTEEIEEKNRELSAINDQLKTSNDQLSEALDQLRSAQTQLVESEKMASLGLLTAGIAHEINNPINFVYAGINSLENNLSDVIKVLQEYEQLSEQNVTKKLVEIKKLKSNLHFEKLMSLVVRSTGNIKKGAERTSEIIKSLKTFSRADNDKLYLMDIIESIDNTLLLLHNQYKDHVTIIKKYSPIPEIMCYPGKINQVFVNIVSNAIHAIDKKGAITISTQVCKKKGLDYIEINIEDTGKGMSKEVQKRIFEPFFTLKDVGEGTGLGLSISHGIIENHNGFIEVKSEEGKGTVFSIYLPVV